MILIDNSLHNYINRENELVDIKYVALGKTVVRLLIYSKEFIPQLKHQLDYTLMDEADDFSSTIVLWKEKDVLGVRSYYDKTNEFELLNNLYHTVILYDEANKTYYFGFDTSEPEEMAVLGHLFVQLFSRILNTQTTHLVHGACVGVNDTGALVCARGGGGKSTLTVLSLLEGMDYVSDDYMVLEREDGITYASPIYSIVTLSPHMYNEMFDKLEGCRFLTNNGQRNKYVLNISNLHKNFKSHYPLKLCIFPEISGDLEPSITPCTESEKGRAITQFTHSTFIQAGYKVNFSDVKKLVDWVKDLPFYNMKLSTDIYKNVEYLRQFINNL